MGFHLDHPGAAEDWPCSGTGSARNAQTIQTYGKPNRQWRVNLIQIIEGEIIPRLFLAHRDRSPHPISACENEAGELGDREFVARLFLSGNRLDILKRLQVLRETGMSRERIYLEVLAPVPGTLSRLWSEEICNFDQVAVGLCCIDDVLQLLHKNEQWNSESDRRP